MLVSRAPRLAPVIILAEAPPLWTRVQKIAAGLEPALRRAFLQAVAGVGEAVAIARLEEALAVSVEQALALLPFQAFEVGLQEAFSPVLLKALGAGAEAGIAQLPQAARFALRFDLTNPTAIRWAEVHAADLVKYISEESRQAIRDLVVRAARGEIDPRQLAMRIREHIGLTPRYSTALDNYRRGLIEQGLKQSRIDALTEKYRKRLLRARAENIARTEAMTAVNEGQLAVWREAANQNLLDPSRTRRVWILSPGACPLCESIKMDSDMAPLFGAFTDEVEGPPAHNQCRCTTGLEFLE